MGPQTVLLALHQMIGIVLHEGGGAVAALAHGLQNGGHGGHLPVALAAVAVALGHQVLGGQAGELLHAVEVLEGVGKGFAALGVHHLFDGDFLSGLIADGVDVVGGHVIAGGVDGHQCVDLRFGDGVHLLHQVAHGPCVHLPAQLGLDLHLVALGDGHFPHIVPKAHDFQALGHGHARGGLHPVAQAGLHLLVLPVPGDDLPGHPQPGGDEAMLPVAMGGLVQVHEVHVDFLVGNLLVVLGGQVAVGLLQIGQAVDPHLGGAEGVAPGDDAGAGIVIVGLLHHVGDLLVGLGGHLIDQLVGQLFAELLRHLGGPGGHDLQHLRAVQVLTAHDEPKFILFHACCPFYESLSNSIV